MRTYWFKIILGALAVFLVGYAGVTLVKSQVTRARRVFTSADPINIPLAFLPFTLDGQKAGTFRRVTIKRESPEVVTGVDFRVSLSDSAAAIPEGCRLTPVDPERFSPETGFRCALDSDSALAEFGIVRLAVAGGADRVIPLVLDSVLIRSLRKEGSGVETATGAFEGGEGAAAAAKAEQIRVRVQSKIDSVRARVEIEAKVAPPAPPEPPKQD